MTLLEQRQHPRYPLTHQPAGDFRLITSAAAYPIKIINDISVSGMRIYLDAHLTPRSKVTVEYLEAGLKLEVNGMIAWIATRLHGGDDGDGRGRFIIGVQLLSPMLMMAMSGTYAAGR